MNALKPAEIVSITMNDEALEAEVLVAEDQLSLAIGKKGQNVRLAAKLTGWEVNIVSADGPRGEGEGGDAADPDAPDSLDAGLAALKAAEMETKVAPDVPVEAELPEPDSKDGQD